MTFSLLKLAVMCVFGLVAVLAMGPMIFYIVGKEEEDHERRR